jgi:hypothetical protein
MLNVIVNGSKDAFNKRVVLVCFDECYLHCDLLDEPDILKILRRDFQVAKESILLSLTEQLFF